MTSLKEVYQLFLKSSGVQTDSRKVTSHQLFFALKGPNFDANAFAQDAIEKGALAAIVDDKAVAEANQNCYLVADVLKTLQTLAQHHRNQFDIPIIAKSIAGPGCPALEDKGGYKVHPPPTPC